MQIHSSPLTSGGGAGEISPAQRSHPERRLERLQKQNGNRQEKVSGNRSSSPRQSSGPNMEKDKVIMGSGGDRAVISRGKFPAATASESPAPVAAAQANPDQQALIDSINLPQRSEEVKTVVADLGAGAENLRQRAEALDAELAQHVKGLAQRLTSPNSFDAIGGDEKSVDDSETIRERIAPIDQKIMMPEQLRQQEPVQAGGNATPAAEPDYKDGKQEERAKGVAQTRKPEYPAPTTDSAGHVEGYL